jgi:CHAD domain-containing protein
MAELSVEAGLSPDEPILEATSKLFAYLWNVAWSHAPGTASGDADALHDMRVALRRLRSALQNFEGTSGEPLISGRVRHEFAAERKLIGKIGDLLGAVRDHDVLDDYLKDYAKIKNTNLAVCPGLTHFERYLQTERAQHFAPMVKRINKALAPGRAREEFARWALGLPGIIGTSDLTLRQAAAIIIPQRVDDVYAHAFALADGADAEGHHEFRKTLRRLRYALETLGVCFEEATKVHIKKLVAMQDALGEMQDREVLHITAMQAFPQRAATGADGAATAEDAFPADVAAFIRFGEMRRRRLLGEARAFWKEHESGGVFDDIRALIK